MANIVLAWELGGGYGHLDQMFRVGTILQARDHNISYIVRDLARAELRAKSQDLAIFQAPYYARRGANLPAAINFSDILLRCGFENPVELTGLVGGWLQLFKLIKPDLLLSDHAPSAMLAARFMNIPVCNAATGFVSPPIDALPLPAIQPWKPASNEQLIQKDAAALNTINRVADNLGGKQLGTVGQLFDVENNYLCTFPELDHYDNRQHGVYCGPIYNAFGESFTAWENSRVRKIFIYLSATHNLFKPLIEQLRNCQFDVLVHARDLSWNSQQQSIDHSLYISPAPVDIKRVVKHTDLVICHGGHATSSAVLLGGIPLIIIPQQLEQTLFAHRLAARNLAAVVTEKSAPVSWIDFIEQYLADRNTKKYADDFQLKYKSYRVDQSCQIIADGVKQVLTKANAD